MPELDPDACVFAPGLSLPDINQSELIHPQTQHSKQQVETARMCE